MVWTSLSGHPVKEPVYFVCHLNHRIHRSDLFRTYVDPSMPSTFPQPTPSTTFFTSYKALSTYTTFVTNSATPFIASTSVDDTARKNNWLIGFIILCIFAILGLIILSVLLSQRQRSQMASIEAGSSVKLPQRLGTVIIPLKGTPTHGQETGSVRRPAPIFMGHREVSTPAHWFGQVPREPSKREDIARKRSLQAQARQASPKPQDLIVEDGGKEKPLSKFDKPLPPPPLRIPPRGSSLSHLHDTYDLTARREAQALSDAKELFRFDF